MIYIEDLIKTNGTAATPTRGLKFALGDAYLLKNNKTYLCRRKLATQKKIKFKKSDNTYNIVPLLCLPHILKSKTVPFYENEKAIRDLLIPKKKITANELIFLGFKKNYILHETSHVIMWNAVQKNIDFSKKNELVISYLLSESYANYSEVIANTFAKNDLHKNHLMLNSFWEHSEAEVATLAQLYKKHSYKIINTSLFLCFLYSNFLYKKISNYECESIRQFIGSSAENLTSAEIKSLFVISSQLNSYFILKTGEIFWKTLGLNEDIFKNLDFDPVDFLLDHPNLSKNILELLALD
jgi:hypothetical protein